MLWATDEVSFLCGCLWECVPAQSDRLTEIGDTCTGICWWMCTRRKEHAMRRTKRRRMRRSMAVLGAVALLLGVVSAAAAAAPVEPVVTLNTPPVPYAMR